ncbi:hypothetical protein RKE29_01770 [Streptomyces sp. B1866]|uniref:hypothetical protein n=1 Tax=Streptomyces sp. B1866 TaxID=3075431 RepID=UPI0028909A7A|nr:hypothetical protein [Streptomyces sp. B1866]MDT3395387.1 hypothetical protein [Streptomyces sp. B1866]
MSKYGRDDLEWDELVEAGTAFLVERARLGELTTYAKLNEALEERTGLPGFDFERPDQRAAMGHLLGLIVERDHPETGLMLSALVIYSGANDAGSGFYALAQQLGLLRTGASKTEKEAFWIEQTAALYALYGRAGGVER